MQLDDLKDEIINKYNELGEKKFVRLMLFHAMAKIVAIEKNEYKGTFPHIEFIDINDKLIILYRREGENIYLHLAKIFRQLAHKVYRIMLKKNLTNFNVKFLNLV